MILIADSSALIALAICESLDLLDRLYGEVRVVQTVFDEVTSGEKNTR
jgi:predicted nucleic acid-binding protein